jgi:MFS superfamily sulfate permease-like transporter
MLVFTGTRLASPNEFRHAYHLGKDQLFLFLTTLVLTLAVDLLVGVAAGLLLKIILHHFRGASLRAMFKTKVVREDAGEEMRVAIQGAASFASLLKVRRHLKDVSENIKVVKVDLREASMVDHTFLLRLDAMAMEWPNAKLEIVGLDTMKAAAHHPHAVRTRG